MHPINECVVKVTARCNIDCDYCYEFNLGDTNWKRVPKRLSLEVVRMLASRIAEHALSHQLPRFFVGLHGGEPLMVGARSLDEIACALRLIETPNFEVDLSIQTNATLATPEICGVIRKHRIAVGVSIDGPRAAHDLHRVDHQGRTTFDATMRGIEVLREHTPEQLNGVLAVIDLVNDPLETLDFIGSLGIQNVDFLLPHYHWDRPPPRPDSEAHDAPAYGAWYYAIWRAWVGGHCKHLRIRFLEHLVRRLVGGRGLFEQMTTEPATLVTIGTDGEIEGVDTLKSSAPGVQQLGYNVFRHSFDEVLAHEHVRMRQSGLSGLCDECRACNRVATCAGGYIPHRYGRGRGFANPSVYCRDLYWLIGRIREDLTAHRRKLR